MAERSVKAVGIDLGSTCARMGIFNNGEFQPIEYMGDKKIPLYVAFGQNDDSIEIGNAAKNMAMENPKNTVFDLKSLVGRGFSDPELQTRIKYWPFTVKNVDNIPTIEVDHNGRKQELLPEQIFFIFIKKIKAIAEIFLGEKEIDAVFTVPTTFDNLQRQIIMNIGTNAGFNILRLINEPTAAAITYEMVNEIQYFERNILVFQLGGSTLNLSIITIDGQSIDVKSSMGDSNFGGSDFDKCLTENLITVVELQTGNNFQRDKMAIQRLLVASENAKKELTSSKVAGIKIDGLVQDYEGDPVPFETSISRDQFEELNAGKFQKIKEMVRLVLSAADMEHSQVHEFFLVGEATLIPKIHDLFQNLFDEINTTQTISTSESVVYGAAAHAAVLSGDTSVQAGKVQDVATSSFGVQVFTDLCNFVIEKNETIPMEKDFELTLRSSNSPIVFNVYEGESHIVHKNRLLGKYTLTPKKDAEIPSTLYVTIQFHVNENGILSLSTYEYGGDIFKVKKEIGGDRFLKCRKCDEANIGLSECISHTVE